MKLKAAFTVLSIAFATCIGAQVPGFMGKRVVLGVQTSLAPGFPLIFWGETDLETKTFLGFTPAVYVDFALDRDQTIGIKYSYSKYKFGHRYFDNTIVADTNLWNVNPANQQPPQLPLPQVTQMNLINHTLTFSWKRFITTIPAPLGRYVNLDFGLSVISAHDINGVVPRSNGNNKKGVFITSIQPLLGIGWGAQRVVFNRIMLNYNLNINVYPLMFFKETEYNDVAYLGYETYVKVPNEVRLNSSLRAISSNAIFLCVTIGFGTVL